MGQAKGTTHRYHSKAFKLEQVRKVLSGIGTRTVAKEAGIGDRLLRNWVTIYTTIGETGLEDKKRPGNPLAKYARRKELTEVEQLRFELAKAEIEIAKLKKALGTGRRNA